MPRARDKSQLIDFGAKEYDFLLDLISDISVDVIVSKDVFKDRTIKDIIAHLHAWHGLVEIWYTEGMKGEKPQIPAPGYSFKDTPKLNEKLYLDYKDVPWDEVIANFKKSHKKMMKIVNSHTDKEITEKKKYKWTGTTNLASYMASATSSHYVWASDNIKKFKKTL